MGGMEKTAELKIILMFSNLDISANDDIAKGMETQKSKQGRWGR